MIDFFAALSWAFVIYVLIGLVLTYRISSCLIGEDTDTIYGAAVLGIVIFSLVYIVAYSFDAYVNDIIYSIPKYVEYYIGFILVGVIWSIFKWVLYIRGQVNEMSSGFISFEDYKKQNPLLAEQYTDAVMMPRYYSYVSNHIKRTTSDIRLIKDYDLTEDYKTLDGLESMIVKIVDGGFTAKNKKSLIVAWIIFWPFSLVETMILDWVRSIVDKLYEYISDIYGKIASAMIKPSIKSGIVKLKGERNE